MEPTQSANDPMRHRTEYNEELSFFVRLHFLIIKLGSLSIRGQWGKGLEYCGSHVFLLGRGNIFVPQN